MHLKTTLYKSRIIQACYDLLQVFAQSLIPADEIRINQVDTAQDGSPRFNAYDPIQRLSISSATEDELRIWLEQRLHARHQYQPSFIPFVRW